MFTIFLSAIALSLQEAKMAATPPPTQPKVIAKPEPQLEDIPIAQTIASHLPQDDDDALFQAELERAIEISKAESQPPTQDPKQEPLEALVLQPLARSSAPQSPSRHANSPLMFDRAQMERDRLARQKRLRPDIVHQSASSQSQDDHASEGEDGELYRDRKRQRLSQPLHSRLRTDAASSSTRPEAGPSSSRSQALNGSQGNGKKVKQEGDGIFWKGEMRQTANRHVNQGGNDRSFRLSEIFGPVSMRYSFMIVDVVLSLGALAGRSCICDHIGVLHQLSVVVRFLQSCHPCNYRRSGP